MIGREEEAIEKKQEQRHAIRDNIKKIDNQHDLALQQKATLSLQYKELVDAIDRKSVV